MTYPREDYPREDAMALLASDLFNKRQRLIQAGRPHSALFGHRDADAAEQEYRQAEAEYLEAKTAFARAMKVEANRSKAEANQSKAEASQD